MNENKVSELSTPELGQALTRLRSLKIALVHYWLLQMRGGEKVLEALCELFPSADVYTLFYDREGVSEPIRRARVTPSVLQKLPGARRYYRNLLPFFPLALEQFDLSSYDLVITSESGPAKGVVVPARTCHLCYCHTPMRYIWDMYHFYRDSGQGVLRRAAFGLIAHYLRQWDLATANRVDFFAANSSTVQARIRKHYRRSSVVIPPPVDVNYFRPSSTVDDYYLFVGQLVSYKRVDLAIQAFNSLGKPFVIVGEGPESGRLKKIAAANIKFMGHRPQQELADLYAHTRAVIMPNEEDAGIVPLEAQASGRPVIALGKGGVLDTVIEGETGMFFQEETAEGLIAAVKQFEAQSTRFLPARIRHHAEQFGQEQFKARMVGFIDDRWQRHQSRSRNINQKTARAACQQT